MIAPVLKPEMLCQIGIVVHDIEATGRNYAGVLGLPMPKIVETRGYDHAGTVVDGSPSEATAKLAFFETGQIALELIQPDERSSVWRDFLDTHGEGVHHIAFLVEDTKAIEKALVAEGMKTLQQGLYIDGSGMYTYVDSAPRLGVLIELLENFR
jgi:methylmalonyl-CoA/ethylmalonyl-CoA epimerase